MLCLKYFYGWKYPILVQSQAVIFEACIELGCHSWNPDHGHMYLCTGSGCWPQIESLLCHKLSVRPWPCHLLQLWHHLIVKTHLATCPLWKQVNCDPEQNPSSLTSAFKTELFLFPLTYSNTVPHCITSVLLCFFVYNTMWKKIHFCCLLWENIFTHKPGSHAYFIQVSELK